MSLLWARRFDGSGSRQARTRPQAQWRVFDGVGYRSERWPTLALAFYEQAQPVLYYGWNNSTLGSTRALHIVKQPPAMAHPYGFYDRALFCYLTQLAQMGGKV